MQRIDTLAAALILTASTAGAQSGEPVLVPLGSTAVVDTDTLFLTVPIGIAVGAHGTVYVIEGREKRVLEIDSAGVIRRVFGRAGRGPGEFESPATMTISGDTLLAVYDRAVRRVTLIDLRSGTHTAIVRLQETRPPSMRIVGSQLMVRSWDLESKTSFATLDLAGQVQGREGVIPAVGLKHPMLIQGVPLEVPFVVSGNDVFAMFEVSPSLFHWSRGSRTATEIPVPKLRRRGVNEAFFDDLMQDPGRAQAMFWNRSIPVAVDVVAPGMIAVVTLDVTVDGQMWSLAYHLTLVDHRQSRACVDVVVPASRTPVANQDPRPVIALLGDLLTVLEYALDPADDPVPSIRRYRIAPEACASWVPLR